jgi:hypothetical protein
MWTVVIATAAVGMSVAAAMTRAIVVAGVSTATTVTGVIKAVAVATGIEAASPTWQQDLAGRGGARLQGGLHA